jgi:hypothetical protein
MTIDLKLFGPIGAFAGTWQSSSGDDMAPGDLRDVEKNAFREEIVFTPVAPAPTANHEQTLYVLSYKRTAWRLSEGDPFHHQLGYWLWDPAIKKVMHSFIIPRGVTVLAGGDAKVDSSLLLLKATLGSPTFGICSNPFLEEEFRTIAYAATITFHSPQSFSYREDTQIQIKGQTDLFRHVDQNTLEKIAL